MTESSSSSEDFRIINKYERYSAKKKGKERKQNYDQS